MNRRENKPKWADLQDIEEDNTQSKYYDTHLIYFL